MCSAEEEAEESLDHLPGQVSCSASSWRDRDGRCNWAHEACAQQKKKQKRVWTICQAKSLVVPAVGGIGMGGVIGHTKHVLSRRRSRREFGPFARPSLL